MYQNIPPSLIYLSSSATRNNDGTYRIVNKFRDSNHKIYTFTFPCVAVHEDYRVFSVQADQNDGTTLISLEISDEQNA